MALGRSPNLVRAPSLREQAAESIRSSIVAGELPAGQIFSATVLAQQLGVSATPVREAMLDLANAGLVVPVRNRGFRIVGVDDHDLDEIAELRLMLEVPASRKVATTATAETVAALEAVSADVARAAEQGDVRAFLHHDRRFHLMLMDAANNQRLTRLVAQLRDQTRLAGLPTLAAEHRRGLLHAADEHQQLIDAIRAHDGPRAEHVMRDHLRHTRGLWAGRNEDGTSAAANGDEPA